MNADMNTMLLFLSVFSKDGAKWEQRHEGPYVVPRCSEEQRDERMLKTTP